MAVLISYEITPQNFEILAKQIATLLFVELQNQFLISTTTPNFPNVNVFFERFAPFNKAELPAINVYFDNSGYTQDTPGCQKGENRYLIDVHTKAATTDTQRGDEASSVLCQKISGAIRYILTCKEYAQLGLTGNIIRNKTLLSIKIGKTNSDTDSESVMSGRLELQVDANENQIQDLETQQISSIFTNIKIGESQDGYQIEVINN